METPTHEEFRHVGYTAYDGNFPMDDLALKLFIAWTGYPDAAKFPRAMKYHPNEWSRDAWTRVAAVVRAEANAEIARLK